MARILLEAMKNFCVAAVVSTESAFLLVQIESEIPDCRTIEHDDTALWQSLTSGGLHWSADIPINAIWPG